MDKKDYFVALSECHFMNEDTLHEVSYYPGVQEWWGSVDGVMRAWLGGRSLENPWPAPRAHELIKYMDQAGVDVAFALREPAMNVSGYTASLSTNGFMMKEIEPYPDRMYLEANVGPILRRGMKHALWELEYLVKERGAKLCKVYQPEDDAPLNDPRMWPFYEKACELDVTLTIHTGTAYVRPHPCKYTHPRFLDDICLDFPDLRIIAYHMAWPHTEELIGLAGKHRNLYLSMSGIIGWYTHAPYRGYHAIGNSLVWAGNDKIVMGLDLPFDETKRCVDWIRNLEMPEELQEKWGYPAITDETRANILGLTLAKLAKIEPTKRVKSK
jgi:predicted TIM-barrel fold metal-dependent hydrolase